MKNDKSFYLTMLVGTLFFVSNAPAGGINVSDPPQGLFYEQYYSLYLGQTKCGWASYSLVRQNDRIQGTNKTHIEIGRDNLTIAVDVSTKTVESLTARPLSFESEVVMAGSKTIYRGDFNGNKVHMTIVQDGQSVEHHFTLPADTTMMWGDYLKTRKHLNKPGSSYSAHSFDPTLGPGKVMPMQVQIVGPAETTIAGKKISGIKIIAKSELLGPSPIVTFADAEGNMLATEMQMGFMKIQMVADTKQVALSKIRPEEIFSNTFVKLSQPLTFEADQPLTLKISVTGESVLPTFPETPRQKILSRTSKSLLLTISPPGNTRRIQKNKEIPGKVFLASSSYANLSDPLLVKLAREGAGSAKDSETAAANLCHFVHEYIRNKNLATPFAGASEVAKTKSGDCTEHAVLLAALARIHKIPSRAVAGLVYTSQGGKFGAFGYHMWTQLWLNGGWVDVDATFDQPIADQTHLALSHWDLADDTFIDQAIKLVHYIGRLKIEPVSRESMGKSKPAA